MKKTIGVIFADSMEFLPFLELAKKEGAALQMRRGCRSAELVTPNGIRLIGVECGIGKVCAASATAFLIADDQAEMIFNAGLSGAIGDVRRGDIVIGSSFTECDFDLTAIGYALGEKLAGAPSVYDADPALIALAQEDASLKTGRLGTGDVFLTDPVRKEQFRELFGLTAFDMETAAIAGVCFRCGVPFLSLRKISDGADDDSVSEYHEMNDLAEDHLLLQLLRIAGRL